MKRYSLMWWLVILPTSVTVGGTSILLASLLTDWGVFTVLAVAAVATALADLAIAAWMESIAPTRVHIGPGEKHLVSDRPAEKAVVVDGFESEPHGHVSIRGETWRAVRAPDDTGALAAGMTVSVVDREGLTLIVSTVPR
ncbi:NfeD family protein [Lentisalinibacter orientalis]|jgi:membrane protein implicated in regulation of membrane protease activity|uniref:NfeD family protein n=1 Tax=Lentisalinibacter orientalis TaxID=2992241 RepID=UPI00386774F5